MKIDRRLALAAATALVLMAAVGVGIAQAVSGSEQPVPAPTAEKAGAAAVAAAGGGTVLGVERQDDDGAGIYEVEIRREGGSQVEIHLDARFEPVGIAADEDSASESDTEQDSDD